MDDPLPRSFYDRHAEQVARELLGKRLVRARGKTVVAGRIVEVEAYLARDDSACHAYRGRTRRNACMFGPPGHAYVYAIHSRFCLNTVTEPEGIPSAVLIRAIEPLEGLGLMKRRRGTNDLGNLTRGPARLCEALAIDRKLDGWDLTCGRQLWVTGDQGPAPAAGRIVATSRIGISSGNDLLLRFFIADSPFVSGPRKPRKVR